MRYLRLGALAVLAWLPFSGCGNVKLPTSLDEAKQAVTDTAEQVKEAAPGAIQQVPAIVDRGSIEVNVGGPVKGSACYATVAAFSSGRPAVLQLKSYQGAAGDAFPAVFVHARLPEGATGVSAGQTYQADVYVQASADAPLWRSDEGSPVELTITTSDGARIAGDIVKGALINTSDGSRTDVTGTFQGVLSQ